MSSLIVQKYGGKCLADVDAIKKVAIAVRERRLSGYKMLVVVSAMGQTTDELIRLAYQISDKPNRRELDMLVTTGERVSMALVSMALQDCGVPSISFTGSQAGVLTDTSHSQARILNIHSPRVQQALDQNQVVVLAGFQGVSASHKEVTTLGRGGTDTTAVAMAGALKAARCEILKDVDGICSADPKIVHNPRSYQTLGSGMVREMCFWGAKILHLRAVELAQKLLVPLFVGRALQSNLGTYIDHKEPKMYERPTVLGVQSHVHCAHVKIPGQNLPDALTAFQNFLEQESLPTPLILNCDYKDDICEMIVTNDSESLQALLTLGEKQKIFKDLHHTSSSVTITGFGLHGTEMLSTTLQKLKEHNVHSEKILINSQSLTFFVAEKDRLIALQALHALVDQVQYQI